MGRTSELYKKLLCQELWGENFKGDLSYKEKLIYVSPDKLQEAIEKVKEKLDRLYPNKKKVKRKFKEICNEQKILPELYRQTEHDKKSKKRYGEGIKFEQYKKNRDQLINQMVEEIGRDIAWNNALLYLGISTEDAKKLKTGDSRWSNLLMKTGNDEASKAHNLKIVSLLARGKGLITDETFKKKRLEQCKKYEKKSDEEAEQIVNHELNNIGDTLWDEIIKKVKPEMRDSDKKGEYVNAILTGKTGKNGNPGLDKCYKSISGPDDTLYWDLQFCVENIKNFPGFNNYKEKREFAVEQQEKAQINTSLKEYVEFAANPFFCVVDPLKTIELSKKGRAFETNVPIDREPTLDEELRNAFSGHCVGIYSNKGGREEELLAPFGLSADEKVVYEKNGNRVFRDNYGNTCILRYQEMGDRAPIYVDKFHPEDLVNTGLEKEMGEFLHTCKSWSREKHTSDEFENMRNALERLSNGGKLLYAPDSNDINPMRARLNALLSTSKDYLIKKDNENSFFRSSYEKRRIAFANKLKEFASRKLEELQYVEEHMTTLEKSKKAEKDLEKNEDYIASKQNPTLKNKTPLQYLKYIEKQKAEAEERERQAREEAEKRKGDEEKKKIEEAEQLQEGKEILKKMQKLQSGIAEKSSDQNNAQRIVDDYLKKEKSEYKPLKDGKDKNQNINEEFVLTEDDDIKGRRIFAGNVINEMLATEKNPDIKSDHDFNVHEIVNGGKISEFVDIIMNYSKFNEKFNSIIPNTALKMTYVIECNSENAGGRVRGNAFYVFRNLKNDIKLAIEDAKKREMEKPALEDADNVEENNIINENVIVVEDDIKEENIKGEKIDIERNNTFAENGKKSEEKIDDKSDVKVKKTNLKELLKIKENESKVKVEKEENINVKNVKEVQKKSAEDEKILKDEGKDVKRERVSLNINNKSDIVKKDKVTRTKTFSRSHSNAFEPAERKK